MISFNFTEYSPESLILTSSSYDALIKLFLPPIFTEREGIINKFINWFYGDHVLLYNVNYVPYNFSKIEDPNVFIKVFKLVNESYDIAEHEYNY